MDGPWIGSRGVRVDEKSAREAPEIQVDSAPHRGWRFLARFAGALAAVSLTPALARSRYPFPVPPPRTPSPGKTPGGATPVAAAQGRNRHPWERTPRHARHRHVLPETRSSLTHNIDRGTRVDLTVGLHPDGRRARSSSRWPRKARRCPACARPSAAPSSGSSSTVASTLEDAVIRYRGMLEPMGPTSNPTSRVLVDPRLRCTLPRPELGQPHR